MKNTMKPQMTVDNFFKSKTGQENYDAEIARLSESRIRLAQWKKEEARRAAVKNKRNNNFL